MNINLALFLLIGGLAGPLLASDNGAAAAASDEGWREIKKGLGRSKQKSPELSVLDKAIDGEAYVRQLSDARKAACVYCNGVFRAETLDSRINHLRKCALAHAV